MFCVLTVNERLFPSGEIPSYSLYDLATKLIAFCYLQNQNLACSMLKLHLLTVKINIQIHHLFIISFVTYSKEYSILHIISEKVRHLFKILIFRVVWTLWLSPIFIGKWIMAYLMDSDFVNLKSNSFLPNLLSHPPPFLFNSYDINLKCVISLYSRTLIIIRHIIIFVNVRIQN